MKSGNIIETSNVEKISVKYAASGGYSEYTIKWEEGKRPNQLFSIDLLQVEAIVASEE